MGFFEFFESHAGKSVLGISAAGFLLAWPPALPWIAAAVLLQFGVRHLALAFKEAYPDETSSHAYRSPAADSGPALPSPDDGERRLAGARNGAVPARSPLD